MTALATEEITAMDAARTSTFTSNSSLYLGGADSHEMVAAAAQKYRISPVLGVGHLLLSALSSAARASVIPCAPPLPVPGAAESLPASAVVRAFQLLGLPPGTPKGEAVARLAHTSPTVRNLIREALDLQPSSMETPAAVATKSAKAAEAAAVEELADMLEAAHVEATKPKVQAPAAPVSGYSMGEAAGVAWEDAKHWDKVDVLIREVVKSCAAVRRVLPMSSAFQFGAFNKPGVYNYLSLQTPLMLKQLQDVLDEQAAMYAELAAAAISPRQKNTVARFDGELAAFMRRQPHGSNPLFDALEVAITTVPVGQALLNMLCQNFEAGTVRQESKAMVKEMIKFNIATRGLPDFYDTLAAYLYQRDYGGVQLLTAELTSAIHLALDTYEEELACGTGGVHPPKVGGVTVFDFASGLRTPRGVPAASGLLDNIVHGLHPFVQGVLKEMADKSDSLAILKDLGYVVP